LTDRKQAIRDRIWTLMEERGAAAFPGARGRIPNFVGASAAADRLATLDEWRRARVIKCNPDAPQRYVRLRALREGKVVYMALPRLREARCFWELDPRRLRDLRDIAIVYALAIAASLLVLVVMVAEPQWFFAAKDQLTVVLRGLLGGALYTACGALVIAFIVRRIAAWEGLRFMPMRPMRWYVFLAWPLLIGALLYRLASPAG